MLKLKVTAMFLALVLAMAVTGGCAANNKSTSTIETSGENTPLASAASEPATSNNSSQAKAIIRTGMIKGPSGLGMLGVMDQNSKKQANNIYEFTMAASPAEIQAKLINGELDIAAVPTNMAAALYNKTDKGFYTIAVGTLGMLYLVTKDEEITSFADLEGKTVYVSGQGASPEYILNYLIDKNGLSGKVTVEFKSEHAEITALMAAGEANIAVLPEPFVTTVTTKDPEVKVALDLNSEWEKAAGSRLAMTCIVVRAKYLETSKTAVDKFLDDYKASVEFVNANPAEAAALSEQYDLIPAAVAEKAIPKCALVCFEGDDMKQQVGPFLNVLAAADPQSVGGAVPDDAFYYKR